MSDSSNDDALKQAMLKPEDQRTDADWELLANAFESDQSHLDEVAHEVGAEVNE